MHLSTYYKVKRREISGSNPSHAHNYPKSYYYHAKVYFGETIYTILKNPPEIELKLRSFQQSVNDILGACQQKHNL
jgi:hypothetical protein